MCLLLENQAIAAADIAVFAWSQPITIKDIADVDLMAFGVMEQEKSATVKELSIKEEKAN